MPDTEYFGGMLISMVEELATRLPSGIEVGAENKAAEAEDVLPPASLGREACILKTIRALLD